MGYYSDVYICTNNNIADAISLVLEANSLKPDDVFSDSVYTSFTLYSLKWYGSFNDVATIRMFLQLFPDDCALIAIGEDNEISDQLNEPWDFEMYTQRIIDW